VKPLPVAPGRLGPTPHRLQHGPVELLPATIADGAGAVAQPYRSIDTVALLLKRGAITPRMAAAADEFRRAFHVAHLDPLRAADMTRTTGTGPRSHDPPTWARRVVVSTLEAIGGTQAYPGSCLWHCIGAEVSVRKWSLEVAGIHPHEGRGVLVATLVFLAEITRAGRRETGGPSPR
jgi:hypothetical protein